MAIPKCTTSIQVRPEILAGMEKLKLLKAAQSGRRESMGSVVEALVLRELARLDAEQAEAARAS